MPIAAAALIGGGSLLSGLFGAGASQSAASQQSAAAQAATQAQLQEFAQTQQNLYPFIQRGQGANEALASLLGINANGGNIDQSAYFFQSPQQTLGKAPTFTGLNYNPAPFGAKQYHESPGYQFQLNQGLNAIQNSAAGQTGAVSGNMLKALQTYGTGLANQDFTQAQNTYYQNYANKYAANEGNLLNQYNSKSQNYWNTFNADTNQKNNIFNMLAALSSQGSGTGAGLGQIGANVAGQVGGNIIGAGNAQAAGTIGAANNLTGGLSGAINNITSPNGNSGSSILQALLGGGSGQNFDAFGGSGADASLNSPY